MPRDAMQSTDTGIYTSRPCIDQAMCMPVVLAMMLLTVECQETDQC